MTESTGKSKAPPAANDPAPPPPATGATEQPSGGAAGADGAGAAEGQGGGAAQSVDTGAQVAGSAADTTASVAGAAGASQVAGGAGVASGAAAVTSGGAQMAQGDLAGGASTAASGAGAVSTSALEMSAEQGGEQAGDGGTAATAAAPDKDARRRLKQEQKEAKRRAKQEKKEAKRRAKEEKKRAKLARKEQKRRLKEQRRQEKLAGKRGAADTPDLPDLPEGPEPAETAPPAADTGAATASQAAASPTGAAQAPADTAPTAPPAQAGAAPTTGEAGQAGLESAPGQSPPGAATPQTQTPPHAGGVAGEQAAQSPAQGGAAGPGGAGSGAAQSGGAGGAAGPGGAGSGAAQSGGAGGAGGQPSGAPAAEQAGASPAGPPAGSTASQASPTRPQPAGPRAIPRPARPTAPGRPQPPREPPGRPAGAGGPGGPGGPQQQGKPPAAAPAPERPGAPPAGAFQPPPWLGDLAGAVSGATAGAVPAGALMPQLQAAVQQISQKGGNPAGLLEAIRFQGGELISKLKDKLEELGARGEQVLAPVLAWLRKWKAQLQAVRPPDPDARPLRPPVDLGDLTPAQRYDYFRRVVTEVMGGQWAEGDRELNLIGVRNFRNWRELEPDQHAWNDSVIAVYKEGEDKRVEGFLASLDPSRLFTERPAHPAGAAHLAEGHYTYKVFELGLGKQRRAFARPEGPVQFWRDRDRDGEQDEDETVRTGRIGLWIMPCGLNPRWEYWHAGHQLVAGGLRGPWRRLEELMKADPDRTFKYTLVDAARLPLARGNRIFLPLAGRGRPIELRPGPQALQACERLYRENESGVVGGLYPFSFSRTWHGGVHLPAPRGRDQVIAVASGEVVAARLGPIDASKYEYGSPNFVLLRHEMAKPGGKPGEKVHWFSLYMHLQPVRNREFPWVRRVLRDAERAQQAGAGQQGGAGQQAAGQQGGGAGQGKADELVQQWKQRAEKAKQALDKALRGEVSVFEPGLVEVAAGERIAFAASYGKPRRRLLHFEVFSPGAEDPVIPKDNKAFEFIEDRDESGVCKVAAILERIDVDKDRTITAEELRAAYRDPGVAAKMRQVVLTHPSEWFIDWASALPQSDYWKKFYPEGELRQQGEQANRYTWHDGKLGDWGLRDKVVTNYHPIRFLRYVLGTREAAAQGAPFHLPRGRPWLLPRQAYQARFLRGAAK